MNSTTRSDRLIGALVVDDARAGTDVAASACAAQRNRSFGREAAAIRARTHRRQAATRVGRYRRANAPDRNSWRSHQLELDALAQTGEQRRPVSGKSTGCTRNSYSSISPQICQRQGERHATHEQALAGLLLELLNRLPQVASHAARHSNRPRSACSTRRTSSPGRWSSANGISALIHPVRPRARGRLPPRRLHHLVGHPAEEQGIGSCHLSGPVAHRLLVRREPCLVMAAAVERDVDRVSKRSHLVAFALMRAARRRTVLQTTAGAHPRPAARTDCPDGGSDARVVE